MMLVIMNNVLQSGRQRMLVGSAIVLAATCGGCFTVIGDPVGLISGVNKVYFETDRRALEILVDYAEKNGITSLVGTIATGDKFITEKADKDRISAHFGAAACEMEGGAIAHTAFVNGTSFIVVRAISDSADGDASMDYATFLPNAVKISTELTLALIEKY